MAPPQADRSDRGTDRDRDDERRTRCGILDDDQRPNLEMRRGPTWRWLSLVLWGHFFEKWPEIVRWSPRVDEILWAHLSSVL